jgi:predicted dehydrogenase
MKINLVIKILIVGIGSIGSRHLRLIRKMLPEALIGVLRHDDTSPLPEFADLIFFGIEDALDFNPQISIICNPAPYHLEIALPLAMQGSNLLIEKPISSSLVEAENFLLKSTQFSGKITIGYNLRYSKVLNFFKEHINANLIGKILSIRCDVGHHLSGWRQGADYQNGVSAKFSLGGGVLLELSHELDYMSWLFGEPKWLQAYVGKQSLLNIDVEDTAHLVVAFSGNQPNQELIAQINLDFIRRDSVRSCTVIAENRTLRMDLIRGVVEVFSPDKNDWECLFKYHVDRDETYISQLQVFLDSIKVDSHPLVSIESGVKVLKLVEAAKRSSNDGVRIYL